MNIPEMDRPICTVKVNTYKRPGAAREIAAWLRKQADYIVKHEKKNSQHLSLRLFASENCRMLKQVGQRDIL
jgi:hypothetical protein